MDNYAHITKSQTEIHATFIVKGKRVGIIITSIFTFCAFAALVTLLSQLSATEIRAFIIPAILLISALIYFPFRYILWNIYGRENFIITTKSITYWYDYGIIRTNPNTIYLDNLGINFFKTQERDEAVLGQISFASKDEKSGLYNTVYTTTVLVTLGDLAQLDAMISELFRDNPPTNDQTNTFSLN